MMQSTGERRAREQDQRHVESMAALDAQAQALRAQSGALAELIRRTGRSP